MTFRGNFQLTWLCDSVILWSYDTALQLHVAAMGFGVTGQGFTAQLLSHIQTYCSSFMSQHLPATWKHHLFYVYIYIPQCLPRSKQFSTAGNPANGLPLQPSNSDHRGGGRGMSLLLKINARGWAGRIPSASHCQPRGRSIGCRCCIPSGSLHRSVVPNGTQRLCWLHFWGEKRHNTVHVCFSVPCLRDEECWSDDTKLAAAPKDPGRRCELSVQPGDFPFNFPVTTFYGP